MAKESKFKDMLEKMGMYNKRFVGDDTAENPDNVDEFSDEYVDADEFVQPQIQQQQAEQPEYDYAPYQPEPSVTVPKYESYTPPAKTYWDDELSSVSSDAPTAQYLDIEQLYKHFRLKYYGTDTIYLIEDYIKTLPDSLPVEMRRSIVLKIVNSSGFDFDKLLNDGIDRVAKLNEYSNSFAAHTEEVVSKNSAEIAVLEQQIERIRENINERKNLHKRQFLTIENEAQRLKEILDFITK